MDAKPIKEFHNLKLNDKNLNIANTFIQLFSKSCKSSKSYIHR